MNHKINLSIIARDGVAYEEEANSLTIPTKAGVITVLPDHTELVSVLSAGDIVVRNEKEEKNIPIRGGVIEVRSKSTVIVLADIVK